MKDIERLLHGAIDMHVHAYPDVSLNHPQHRTNDDVIAQCRAAGMGGLVLKTHGWPSVGLAHQLNSEHDDFTVYPSASLNTVAGGPHPWVVEMAIEMGCKMIWLPTWSAASDHEHTGFGVIAEKYIPRCKTGMREQDFYYLLDEKGQLLEEIKECVVLCRDHDVVLGTGHISAEESFAVGRFAREIGFNKVCLTHPSSSCSFNQFEQIKAFAQMGHYIELCALNVAPMYTSTTIEEMGRIIKEVGADHCYISTDHFFDWTPSIPQQIYQVLGCLLEAGIRYEELQTVMDIPKLLFGVK